jgi:hypothetical protein
MNRRSIFTLSAITVLGLTFVPGSAFAQTAKDLVGTWKMVTNINTAPDGRKSVWPHSEFYTDIRC